MKRYHPRSWLQSIPPSAPCDHMSEAPTGCYVETQDALAALAESEAKREAAESGMKSWQALAGWWQTQAAEWESYCKAAEREAGQWREAAGQATVRAEQAEDRAEKAERERDEARAEVETLAAESEAQREELYRAVVAQADRVHLDNDLRMTVKQKGPPAPKKVCVAFNDGTEHWYEPDENVNALMSLLAEARTEVDNALHFLGLAHENAERLEARLARVRQLVVDMSRHNGDWQDRILAIIDGEDGE